MGGLIGMLWIMPAIAQTAPEQPANTAMQVLRLDQAQGWITVLGTQESSVDRALAQLPYKWDAMHEARSGRADFEIAFELPGEPTEPHAVFLPHLGNRFELWLNGVLISRGGSVGAGAQMGDLRADFGKAPRYVAIAPNLLQKSNLVRIRLEADGGRRAGVMPLLIGPEQEVREAYERAFQRQSGMALAVLTLMLVLAGVSASLWFTQAGQSADLRDPLYAYAAVAATAWALYLSDGLLERSFLPWPLWGALMAGALSATAWALLGVLIRLAGAQRERWALRFRSLGMGWVLLSTVIAAVTIDEAWPWVLTAWWALGLGVSIVIGCWFVQRALFQGDAAMRVMAVVLFLNVGWAAADFWRYRISNSLSDNAWQSLASAAFALAVFYIVIARFRSASTQARELRHTLEQRIAQREAELAQSYDKLQTLSREQARSEERTRILRDMHDGVGAHISSAIRQVEHGQEGSLARAELLQTLHDSLDQLKLSMDSMHLPAGDINALLANLRYRLEPRLKSSGIALTWDVQVLPEQAHFDHAALRQLQFMLFEAFSNVLQHAQASQLLLAASEQAGRVCISLTDNGQGFDPQQPSRGLASMRERAKAIGAELAIRSQPGATTVDISWLSPA